MIWRLVDRRDGRVLIEDDREGIVRMIARASWCHPDLYEVTNRSASVPARETEAHATEDDRS